MKKILFALLVLGFFSACYDGVRVRVDRDLDSLADKAGSKLDTFAAKVETGAEKAWDSTKVDAARAWDSTKAKAKDLKNRIDRRIDRDTVNKLTGIQLINNYTIFLSIKKQTTK